MQVIIHGLFNGSVLFSNGGFRKIGGEILVGWNDRQGFYNIEISETKNSIKSWTKQSLVLNGQEFNFANVGLSLFKKTYRS